MNNTEAGVLLNALTTALGDNVKSRTTYWRDSEVVVLTKRVDSKKVQARITFSPQGNAFSPKGSLTALVWFESTESMYEIVGTGLTAESVISKLRKDKEFSKKSYPEWVRDFANAL